MVKMGQGSVDLVAIENWHDWVFVCEEAIDAASNNIRGAKRRWLEAKGLIEGIVDWQLRRLGI